MTPLQILQLHDEKLSNIEKDFENKIDSLVLESKMNNNLDDNDLSNKIDLIMSNKLTNII